MSILDVLASKATKPLSVLMMSTQVQFGVNLVRFELYY